MTRTQATQRAIANGVVHDRAYVVVEERFRSHKPSYHVLDLPTWRSRLGSRLRGEQYWANWFQVWPRDEAEDG